MVHEGVLPRRRPIESNEQLSLVPDENKILPAREMRRRRRSVDRQDAKRKDMP